MVPPRWFYRVLWAAHNLLDRLLGGRVSTSAPRGTRLGVLFLTTIGRHSGAARRNGLYYLEDGRNMLVMASNAGAPGNPGWWHNLQAHPEATVEIGRMTRPVRARAASPSEEASAWHRFLASSRQYAEYRQGTDRLIPIVVLEPRDDPAAALG